ncbi:S24 family peptidase [Rahnella sp. ChDrAdgB13]|uniref:S24 family peptidase n=1 Tax=Rahnella sp. ChDrAdgB13 TaxID=1850581 RepID=UPI001AD85AB0|nr:S24 family peptidase [Rahnella sp. ChDrAdgB13]
MTNHFPSKVKQRTHEIVNFPRNALGQLIATMPDDTMDGEIGCRNTIIIDNQSNRYLEDGVFAFFVNGTFMVKRLQFVPDGIWVLPNNKHYENFKIEPSDHCELVIIGRVVLSLEERKH